MAVDIIDYLGIGDLDKKDVVRVGVYDDDSCDMCEVRVNDLVIYSGNHWDFHNGCYAGHNDLPDFEDRFEYAQVLCDLLKAEGYIIEYYEDEYEYE